MLGEKNMEKKIKVLIAEEDEDFCRSCRDFLAAPDFFLSFVKKDGAELLSTIFETKPDIVLGSAFLATLDMIGVIEKMGIAEDMPIDARLLSNSIESAQKRLEGTNFERRKNVIAYDDVMNQQRGVIYGQRLQVLHGENAFIV